MIPYGFRFVTATEDIMPGELIAVEKSIVGVLGNIFCILSALTLYLCTESSYSL